jgi:hypothetical protein
MHRPILSALVLALVFSSSALTASAQESDFATKRNFESRATALTARIDAAITTAQLDSLKNDIDVLELDFEQHTAFLDKALYPETFQSRMKGIRDLHARTRVRVGTIQSQGTRIAEMEGAIQTLTYRLDTLSAQRDRLYAELVQNKTNTMALRETLRRLQNMLQTQDKLMFALVDSIFMPYGKDLATMSDVQRDALSTTMISNNLITRVYNIASDNMHFLGATELQGKDFAPLLDHYRQFEGRWRGLSEKIRAVSIAAQSPHADSALSRSRGGTIIQASRFPTVAQTLQVDSLLGEWNTRLRMNFWSAIEREFSSRQIQLTPFSDAPGFSASIRTYVQSLHNSGDDPTLFVEEVWKGRIDKEWRDGLTREGMLGKEEYAALDKLVSELARTRIDMKFVLYIGITGVVVLVLWWLLARKPKAPAKA